MSLARQRDEHDGTNPYYIKGQVKNARSSMGQAMVAVHHEKVRLYNEVASKKSSLESKKEELAGELQAFRGEEVEMEKVMRECQQVLAGVPEDVKSEHILD